jgi:hypothetical protein
MKARRFALSSLAAAILAAGCATAYHDYPRGCVPLNYCAPPPLPYRYYQACPTPLAAHDPAKVAALSPMPHGESH